MDGDVYNAIDCFAIHKTGIDQKKRKRKKEVDTIRLVKTQLLF